MGFRFPDGAKVRFVCDITDVDDDGQDVTLAKLGEFATVLALTEGHYFVQADSGKRFDVLPREIEGRLLDCLVEPW